MANSTSITSEQPSNGVVGGYTGDNVNIKRVMMAFTAIAWYNAIEIMFLAFFQFKRYTGLYFWSLMVTACAIILYETGVWAKMDNVVPETLITQTLDNIGWIFMIGGNSMVLYSRLHLITQNRTLLKCVFWGIIVNCILMYIPTTTLDYGVNLHPESKPYLNGYNIMERIQMTLFSIQEFAISGAYLVEIYRYLKVVYVSNNRVRGVMYELAAVNVLLIILDVALLSVEYADLYETEVTLKGFVYSIKLKLELGVLSRLVKIVTHGKGLQKTATIASSTWNDKGGSFPLEHIETVHSRSTSRADSHQHSRFHFPSFNTHTRTRSGSSIPWLAHTRTKSTSERPCSPTTVNPPPQPQPQPQARSPPAPPPPVSNTTTSSLVSHHPHNNIHDMNHNANIFPNSIMDFVTEPEFTMAKACDESNQSLYQELEAQLGAAAPARFDIPGPVAALLAATGNSESRDGSRRSSIGELYPGRLTG